MPTIFDDGIIVQGDCIVTGNPPAVGRSNLTQEDNARYVIPWEAWRVHDAYGTNLPATPANDDLGLVGGTFATESPSIQTGDLKNAGATTRYARCVVALPHEYVAGQSVTIRVHGGMLTTVASATATVDFEVHKSDDETGVGSDICATAAQSINSLTFSDDDFQITPTSLLPGDSLDIRMAVAVNDSATATAVIGCIGKVELLLDSKG